MPSFLARLSWRSKPSICAAEGNSIKQFASIFALGRASEWWEFKLVPVMAAGYLTALALGVSVWAILPDLGLLLVALVPGAVFVSVLNDWTDKAADSAAGKKNRQSAMGTLFPLSLIILSMLAGAIFIWIWRDDAMLQVTYSLAWLAYALYSIAPIRLKGRGFYGVLCDAFGANVVPALLAVLIVARAAGVELAPYWLPAIAGWALSFGIRGIFWHQIGDFVADQKAGTRTFVARVGIDRCMSLARRVIFPIELVCLALLIVTSGWLAATFALVALALYVQFVRARLDRFEMQMGLVKPRPRGIMILQEYYDVILPIALLLAASFLDFRSIAVLLLHVLLFPIRLRQLLSDAIKLRDSQYESRSKGN